VTPPTPQKLIEELQSMPSWGWPTWADLHRFLFHLLESLMATQAEIDALTTAVNTAVADIQAEIAALQAANPALDLSKLQAAVGSLTALDNANKPAPTS
jgi:hypothetical protein